MTREGTVGLVLAAGAGSRFGGRKLLAPIGGRPILQHVLDALAAAGIDDVVVVLGADAAAIEPAIRWRAERRVINPDPSRGLSSSVAVGFETIGPDVGAVLVALGDQPLVSVEVIGSLLDGPASSGRPIAVPVYADGRGRNPVVVRRAAFPVVGEASGDRGLGPVLEAHPDLVAEIAVEGANPDVDTPGDHARAIEAAWAARVRANREQVERIREVPDGTDFYAPVNSLFRADPTRTDDPVLDALLDLTRSGDTWLDVGAGAGRFALPIARALDASGGSVIALDASPSMLETLREIAEDYAIENVRVVEARWPPTDGGAATALEADVALIAHVGYDIEDIGPFFDALEASATRACVAVLMERVPASAADPFWPPVHGQSRVPLPALPDVLELLEARGRHPDVRRIAIEPRRFETRDALAGFIRRQLWIDPGGEKEERFQAALDALTVADGDGWTIAGRGQSDVGVVTWAPR
ncbi:MAG TPA: NTP transferase domain-containing protein [Candidatus Limnocylindrales bacterium]|nr:NTP transferase domain-containing protein [Candidatus Limnocylindrales bacterium]